MTRSKWAAIGTLVRAVRGTWRPGEPGVGERIRAVPRLVIATVRGRYHGTTKARLGLLAMAVVYVVSPVDVLPDFLPLIGIADDAMVVAWLAGALLSETGDFLDWERGDSRTSRRRRSGRGRFDAGRPDVVRGQVVR
ncbi:MAG TPA: DUF1232 domain-containing protein [Actinomycetales bacterium]|nr:DUF1232 domain-containing protein [Actinomycetales bacterium]